jgi:transcriptional regulator with XRE-family HTH domain
MRELARLAEVPYVTLSELERVLRADVTTATAKRIAQALDTPIDYLVGRFKGIGDDHRSGDRERQRPGEKEGEAMERKLAAILSADVQGYSRLMGEDEE